MPRYARVQREGEPRRRLRGHHGAAADSGAFACHLPLGQQDGVAPGGRTEEVTQERGRDVERDVADDHRRSKRASSRIAPDDIHLREASGETCGVMLVEFNGRQWASERSEWLGQGAIAGAEFGDGTVGRSTRSRIVAIEGAWMRKFWPSSCRPP